MSSEETSSLSFYTKQEQEQWEEEYHEERDVNKGDASVPASLSTATPIEHLEQLELNSVNKSNSNERCTIDKIESNIMNINTNRKVDHKYDSSSKNSSSDTVDSHEIGLTDSGGNTPLELSHPVAHAQILNAHKSKEVQLHHINGEECLTVRSFSNIKNDDNCSVDRNEQDDVNIETSITYLSSQSVEANEEEILNNEYNSDAEIVIVDSIEIDTRRSNCVSINSKETSHNVDTDVHTLPLLSYHANYLMIVESKENALMFNNNNNNNCYNNNNDNNISVDNNENCVEVESSQTALRTCDSINDTEELHENKNLNAEMSECKVELSTESKEEEEEEEEYEEEINTSRIVISSPMCPRPLDYDSPSSEVFSPSNKDLSAHSGEFLTSISDNEEQIELTDKQNEIKNDEDDINNNNSNTVNVTNIAKQNDTKLLAVYTPLLPPCSIDAFGDDDDNDNDNDDDDYIENEKLNNKVIVNGSKSIQANYINGYNSNNKNSFSSNNMSKSFYISSMLSNVNNIENTFCETRDTAKMEKSYEWNKINNVSTISTNSTREIIKPGCNYDAPPFIPSNLLAKPLSSITSSLLESNVTAAKSEARLSRRTINKKRSSSSNSSINNVSNSNNYYNITNMNSNKSNKHNILSSNGKKVHTINSSSSGNNNMYPFNVSKAHERNGKYGRNRFKYNKENGERMYNSYDNNSIDNNIHTNVLRKNASALSSPSPSSQSTLLTPGASMHYWCGEEMRFDNCNFGRYLNDVNNNNDNDINHVDNSSNSKTMFSVNINHDMPYQPEPVSMPFTPSSEHAELYLSFRSFPNMYRNNNNKYASTARQLTGANRNSNNNNNHNNNNTNKYKNNNMSKLSTREMMKNIHSEGNTETSKVRTVVAVNENGNNNNDDDDDDDDDNDDDINYDFDKNKKNKYEMCHRDINLDEEDVNGLLNEYGMEWPYMYYMNMMNYGTSVMGTYDPYSGVWIPADDVAKIYNNEIFVNGEDDCSEDEEDDQELENNNNNNNNNDDDDNNNVEEKEEEDNDEDANTSAELCEERNIASSERKIETTMSMRNNKAVNMSYSSFASTKDAKGEDKHYTNKNESSITQEFRKSGKGNLSHVNEQEMYKSLPYQSHWLQPASAPSPSLSPPQPLEVEHYESWRDSTSKSSTNVNNSYSGTCNDNISYSAPMCSNLQIVREEIQPNALALFTKINNNNYGNNNIYGNCSSINNDNVLHPSYLQHSLNNVNNNNVHCVDIANINIPSNELMPSTENIVNTAPPIEFTMFAPQPIDVITDQRGTSSLPMGKLLLSSSELSGNSITSSGVNSAVRPVSSERWHRHDPYNLNYVLPDNEYNKENTYTSQPSTTITVSNAKMSTSLLMRKQPPNVTFKFHDPVKRISSLRLQDRV